MDLSFVWHVFKDMIPALPITLYITLVPFILALILSLTITLVLYFKIPVIDKLCKVFVSFFRGTPFIGQLFLIYFGIPRLLPILMNMDRIQAFIVTLSLNTAAYASEILRGALLSVDKGQIEAAESIGLRRLQVMKNIVIPQAIPVAIPPLVNNLIDTIKGSSLAFTIGIVDITAVAKIDAGITYQYFEAYTALVILYWIVVLLLEKVQGRLEKKMGIECCE
ncbi:amino acid ABC transporter permease [Tissierella praeacuta]|uniref:amino acid ABC transporter permease n=1 Tax=Tissierella praeacuta TaxID=43131 RepID=UPI00333EDDD3